MDSEKEILLNMADIMEEFSSSYEPYIWELGHYLADNLILKIALYILEKKEKEKLNKTNFPDVYKRLKNHHPNIPDYNLIEPFHKERNRFAHDSNSICSVIRGERAIEYAERVKEIMVSTGLIQDKNDIFGTDYLETGNYYMEGSQIEGSEWTKLIEISNGLHNIWINNISNENWDTGENLFNISKTMYNIRGITKFSTKLENLQQYSILELNKNFSDIIDDLKTLVLYLNKWLDNDGTRIKTLYHKRKEASDQKYINQGLRSLRYLISRGKNRFDIESFLKSLQLIGMGINLFIQKYVKFINPEVNPEIDEAKG